MSGSHRFGVFAKHWIPGKVKTRLAAGIGQDKAASVYKVFLEEQILRYAKTFEPELVVSPDDSVSQFSELVAQFQQELKSSHWLVHSQGDGDLGIRMQRFFERCFESGCSKATLVGSDTPTLPLAFLRQTDQLLNIHDVVLGPTEDGGYYLVAAKQNVPPIFGDITWSSDLVWRQTISKLQEQRVRFAVLPVWYDVDDADDLRRLRAELDSDSNDANAIRLARRLTEILDAETE